MGFDIESANAFITEAITECWKCHSRTTVVCVYCVDATVDDDPPQNITLSNIESFNDVLGRELRGYRWFRKARSKTAEMSYFANHCEQCDALQGDFYLHSEPGGAFFPQSSGEASRIEFIPISGPVAVNGTPGYSSAMDEAFEQWQGRQPLKSPDQCRD